MEEGAKVVARGKVQCEAFYVSLLTVSAALVCKTAIRICERLRAGTCAGIRNQDAASWFLQPSSAGCFG